jgi:succinate dehydrogenase/fumarate reductase flavoprotein subunit
VLEVLPAAALGDLRAKLRPALGQERRGHPAPDVLFGGQALIGRFLLALSKLPNADLRLRSAFIEYVVENGAVVGAVIDTPPQGGKSGRKRIQARGGVIVAAGGFEHNATLRKQSGLPGTLAGAMGPATNTGQPIVAGMAIGAATDLMDQAWWSPGVRHPDGTFSFSLGYTGGIFVDQTGRRFMNESLPYDRAGREMIARMKAGKLQLPIWMIYDNRDSGVPPVQYPNVPFADTADYQAAGCWVSAPTIGELAKKIGVPADALNETVARFNTLAAAGKDSDFGRGTEPYERMFTENRPPLAQIVTAPFHAAAFELSDLGTKGGLKTDTAARVLATTGAPIPGLYAAGNSMAAASGEAYPGGGNPIGSSMVFAFIAAQDIGARLT